MNLINVQSSNISKIGFEKNKRTSLHSKPINVLRIVFNTGMMYDYYNVEEKVFNEFLKAKSIGKYFWANIKDKYSYEKVT